MIKVMTGNTLISDRIIDFQKVVDVITIKHKTLSGDYYFQTVGRSSLEIVVECDVTDAQKRKLEECYCLGSILSVVIDGRSFDGICMDKPEFTSSIPYINNRLYSASFIVCCDEEGIS